MKSFKVISQCVLMNEWNEDVIIIVVLNECSHLCHLHSDRVVWNKVSFYYI